MVTQAQIRARIAARLAELTEENALGAEAQSVVTLDQQAVGRLSRQDALLGQSMAKATQMRRDAEVQRLRDALSRLETDPDFGFCEDCGEAIAEQRMLFDPSTRRCISCATG
ncbi:TraR/DksA family transcriptional regulator [Primorskyibacter sp. S187A]|uniref:TraR/DksA family transcriptional regulator n=1 Tax=Primorskyibacter sp. S187A TaxID=3415130 RepID=UPI003C7BDB00